MHIVTCPYLYLSVVTKRWSSWTNNSVNKVDQSEAVCHPGPNPGTGIAVLQFLLPPIPIRAQSTNDANETRNLTPVPLYLVYRYPNARMPRARAPSIT